MALFSRRGRSAGGGAGYGRDLREDEAHLARFARSRGGVEAFVEPRTAVTETTVVLVAADGEWTRRRVPGPQAAHQLAHRLGIPAYDAMVVGYPQRMRDYSARIAAETRAKREPGRAPAGPGRAPPEIQSVSRGHSSRYVL